MSRGRCPSSRILIGALAPNHDTSRHCWRVDAGQRALGSGSARRLVTTRFDRAMRSALEPALHEDLGAAASTTLERSTGTGSHGAKPTRERRRSCATTSRRRRRLRAPARQQRGLARPAQARAHSNARCPGSRGGGGGWWVAAPKNFLGRLPRIWGSAYFCGCPEELSPPSTTSCSTRYRPSA